MTSEEYLVWAPLDDIPLSLIFVSLHDEATGVRVILGTEEPEPRLLQVTFRTPIGYRVINESHRTRTWLQLAGSKRGSSLLVVRHSMWVEWLVAESSGAQDAADLRHFAIFTADECVDVVCVSQPMAEWVTT